MKKLFLITTIAIATVAAAPAASDAAATNATQPSAQSTDNNGAAKAQPALEEKKVCRLLPSSYSHRSDRVCLTKSQWTQVDKDLDR
jgi:Ni/Co efflux regulator RcnB